VLHESPGRSVFVKSIVGFWTQVTGAVTEYGFGKVLMGQ